MDRAVLGAPQRLESHEGAPVHQKRLPVVETGTQRVADGEAVGVDVAPVVQAALPEQERPAESLEAVTRAEDHHALLHGRKGEKVDLVLGDEHAGDAGTQRRGAFGIEGDILFGSRFTGCRQQGMGRIQHPEANTLGLLPKAVAPGEAGDAGRCARIDRFRRQCAVEQLAEHPSVGLDELAVHPGTSIWRR